MNHAKIRIDTEGRRYLQTLPRSEAPTVPTGFKTQIDERLSMRECTYAMLHGLARMTVSKLTRDDIQKFFTAMTSGGQSPRTIRKEIALLKGDLNSAIAT